MKRTSLLCLSVLLLMLTGCSGDEEMVDDDDCVRGGIIYDGYTQQKTDENDPVAVFFAKELHNPYWDGYGKEHKTFFEQGEWNDESCLMINSRQEFQDAYMGTEELPGIDFNQYTLIVGRTWGEDGSYRLGKIVLRDMGLTYELETQLLRYHYENMGVTLAIRTIYYWRLYPKLDIKEIIPKRTVTDVYDN